MKVGLKLSLAIWLTSRSTHTLDVAYAVTGLNSALSSSTASPAAPYMLHDEANT